jgi:putative phosphoesterase
MKIALFSDIHANLPALNSFFKDVEARKPDMIFCLGDLVGYNIWPNEVIQEIRKRNIPTISGNYDFGIGRASGDCGCAYKTDLDKDMGTQSVAFTDSIVTPIERHYLRNLPAHIKLTFQLNDAPLNLLLVHGSPRKNNEYLFEDREGKSLYRIIEQSDADILCCGHTHLPYHRIVSSEDGTRMRHAINIGSVGKPKDKDPRGSYVMLTLKENSVAAIKESIQVEIIRFEYDVEKAARAIEESPLPNAFAEMLRKGG